MICKNLLAAAAFLVSGLAVTAQPCSDLFFSEYVEGTSNNKVLELYNPTTTAIDLSQYRVLLFSNGGTSAGNTIALFGSLPAGETYVICNSGASQAILAIKDTVSQVTNFNGDDAVVLMKGTDTLDIIGVVGVDPGTEWTVSTGSTLNYTLIRKQTVKEGTTDWTLSATQWNVLPIDDISNLGSHTMDPCAPITDTLVRFSPTTQVVAENSGTIAVNVSLNAASPGTVFTVQAHYLSGDTTQIASFSTANLSFATGMASTSFNLTILNDTLIEGPDTLKFVLRNPSAPLQLGADSVFTLIIGASDNPIVTLPIAAVASLKADGTPDSLGVRCAVTGTVYGVNYRSGGLQFFIRDATDGIGVFENSRNLGYTVNEGDSIYVAGIVSFFSGLTQMGTLDTIIVLGTGTLNQPRVVTALGESEEADLVTIRNCSLVTPSQWNNGSPSGFTVDITDGVSTFALRIDNDVDLYNAPAPTGPFDITGMGSQFDNAAPYTEGYQLLPRYTADLTPLSSVADQESKPLSLYPNPAQQQLEVVFGQNVGSISVYDATGRNVLQTNANGAKAVTLNLSTLMPGCYHLEAQSAETTVRARFMVK